MNPFFIKFTNTEPKYKQLSEHIRQLIISGVLSHQYKLPSIRKLAKDLRINSVTVVSAYKNLEKEGFVYSMVGGGTYVIGENIMNDDEFTNSTKHMVIFDFATSSPSPHFFPVNSFKSTINEVLDRDGGFAFNYQETGGYYPLRQSLQQLLLNYKINIHPEYIHITSGGQQGLDMVAKTLLTEGDYVIVEEPCYPGALASFISRGAKVIGVPIRQHGMDLKLLEKKLKESVPKFIYVMPDFQSPTGYQYDLKHRRKILELANKYNTLVVEDDHFSDLNYYMDNIPPLKALDTENRVIYIKSFSKVFMPGLRLALLVAPNFISEPLREAKQFSDVSSSGLLQRAFDLYLRRDLWTSHVKKVKNIYQVRCQTTVRILEKKLPSYVSFTKPNGGLSIWVQLPTGFSAYELANEAKKRGIIIAPGNDFFINKRDNFFRLSFSNLVEKELETGIELLVELIKSYKKEKI